MQPLYNKNRIDKGDERKAVMKYTILIVEDDMDINDLLQRILRTAGYDVVQAYSGTEAKLRMEKTMPDLILLDLMLPGMSGESLLAYIRQDLKSRVPVFILSAKASLQDKVSLLINGADDYITKPFEQEEVLARMQAALRRVDKENTASSMLSYKSICLDPEARNVYVKDKELSLTAYEYEILHVLIQHPDKVYSRERLYEEVWRGGYYGENNTVNVHVSNLRKKLKEADEQEEYIQTVYGIGFKLK